MTLFDPPETGRDGSDHEPCKDRANQRDAAFESAIAALIVARWSQSPELGQVQRDEAVCCYLIEEE